MVTGFCISKTLMTAVELDVFTKLSGKKTVDIKEFQGLKDSAELLEVLEVKSLEEVKDTV